MVVYSNKFLAFLDFISLLPLEMSMEGKMILTCPDGVGESVTNAYGDAR